MKRYIASGAYLNTEGQAKVDYFNNSDSDILEIKEPQLYESIHNNNIYTFGYAFSPTASSKDRSMFINSIKQLDPATAMNDDELNKFILRPIMYLNEYVNSYDIDCLVYPVSGRSPLVRKIVSAVNDVLSRGTSKVSFELVKSAPTDIAFDFDSFESENCDNPGYSQMIEYINTQLIPKIHSLSYFSIAHDVKPKYRKYITNFIDLTDENYLTKLESMKCKNILVIDDINTTGSTLNEILRKLGKLNLNSQIFVYTLIGK